MLRKEIIMLDDEFWWGGAAHDGIYMPYSSKTVGFRRNMIVNSSPNQAIPFLVSNKGRYIWSDVGFNLVIDSGIITLEYKSETPKLYEGFSCLRDAFIDANKKFFSSNGQIPPADFFLQPQFNTWIELMQNQTQEGILNYAKKIHSVGFPCSVIMIDEGWQKAFGVWEFNHNFPNPKKMVDELHDMNFKVMLWTVPFVTPDTVKFRELREKNYLVKNANGAVAIREWWCGYSALIDFSNPEAKTWYLKSNAKLMNDYGVDGFKLDGGDAYFYYEDDITYGNVSPNQQCEIWAKIGLNYKYNEYRASWNCSGFPLVQRLQDKNHSWDNEGINYLTPNSLAQGIIGATFHCPDMVGGGALDSVLENKIIDEELFVRYAQNSALMPMMQFSCAPWRVLNEQNLQIVKNSAFLHEKFADVIMQYVNNAQYSGEPIVRYMEYQFPNCGYACITDQFMLGEKILVAPVYKKGQLQREVTLPKGKWLSDDNQIYDGNVLITIFTPIERLPYFILQGE